MYLASVCKAPELWRGLFDLPLHENKTSKKRTKHVRYGIIPS